MCTHQVSQCLNVLIITLRNRINSSAIRTAFHKNSSVMRMLLAFVFRPPSDIITYRVKACQLNFCYDLHVASFKKFHKEPIDGKIQ